MIRIVCTLLIFSAALLGARQIPAELSVKAAELYLDNPQLAETIIHNGTQLADVYVSEKGGYVVVPLFRKFRPVLAHSNESIYRPGHPDNLMRQIVIADMTEKLEAQFPKSLVDTNEAIWTTLADNNRTGLYRILEYEEYGPWIEVNWGQGEPYNAYCPVDPETGERSVTGCVMTACAMNLYYWEYPYSIELTSADSYYSRGTSPFVFINAPLLSMDEIHYGQSHTAMMTSDEIAKLMAALGVVIQASYSSTGTSADIEDYHYEERLGYANARDTSPLSANFFDDVAEDMRAGKPVQLSMFDMEDGGHSINVDGWNSADEFHMNLGWSGYENGWYHMETELPSTFDWITRTTIRITAPPHPDVSNSCESAQTIYIRDIKKKSINGLTSADDVDWYRFRARSDSIYVFYTTGPFDTWCEIYDECYGTEYAYADTGGTMGNFSVSFRPERTGYHYIKVGGRDTDPNVNYRLWYMKAGAPPRPYLQIMYPNGNGMYEGGQEIGIYFTRGGEPPIEFVTLEYSIDGRLGEWHTIVDSLTANNYRWTVPNLGEDAWHCWLKISDTNDPDNIDYTDEKFVIRGPDSLTEIPDASSLDIRAWPNPFNGSVQIDLPDGDNLARILDTRGHLLKVIHGSQTWQPSENIPSGVYIVESESGSRTNLLYSK